MDFELIMLAVLKDLCLKIYLRYTREENKN
jgi:hypothetical protein